MTTPLHKNVTRDTGFPWRGLDSLIVRMTPSGLLLKGRGQRWSSAYLIPWAAAYDVAVKMHIASMQREKQRARRFRRAA